jgi:hypothetical protein
VGIKGVQRAKRERWLTLRKEVMIAKLNGLNPKYLT